MNALQYNETVSRNNEDTILYMFNDTVNMEKLLELLKKLLAAETMEDTDLADMEAEYAEKKGAENPEMAEMYAQVAAKKAAAVVPPITPEPEVKPEPPVNPDEKLQFKDPSGKIVQFTYAEYELMQTRLQAYTFAEKKQKVSDQIGKFVFSEQNKLSVILPKHNDKIVDFAMGLNDKQFATFSEILQGMTTDAAALFSEEGANGEGGELTRDEKVEQKAQEIMKEKNWAYKEAVLEAYTLVE